MGAIWLASWLGQSITGHVAFNAERFDHQQAALSWWQYLGTPDFWNRTLQNWQSEFLAVGSMAVLSIYLRQRGSPESKPVGTPALRHRRRRLNRRGACASQNTWAAGRRSARMLLCIIRSAACARSSWMCATASVGTTMS